MMKQEQAPERSQTPSQATIGGEEVREVYDVNLFQRFGLTPTPMPYTSEMFRPRMYAILGIIVSAVLYSIAFGQLGLVATLVIMSPWMFIQLLQFKNPSLRREIIFLIFPLLSVAISTPQGLGESGLPQNAPIQSMGLLALGSLGFIIATTSDIVLTSWVQANFSPSQKFIKPEDRETTETLERSRITLQDTRFSFDFHITEPETPGKTLGDKTFRISVLALLSAITITIAITMFVQFTEQTSPTDPFPTRTYLISILVLSAFWSITMIRELLRQEFRNYYNKFMERRINKNDTRGTKPARKVSGKIKSLFRRKK